MIQWEQITNRNFEEHTLDHFSRTQQVQRVYRKQNSGYALVDCAYTEDWDLQKKRQVAKELLSDEMIAYLAREGKEVVGFIGLRKQPVEGYLILDVLQVSARCRRQGIGRALFQRGMEEARKSGAKGLYISACSSEETVAFYRAMGAVLCDAPIPSIAEEEPFDLQLVCKIP